MQLQYQEIDGIQYPVLQSSNLPKPLGKYGSLAKKHTELMQPWRMSEILLFEDMDTLFGQIDEQANERIRQLEDEMLKASPPPLTDDLIKTVQYRNQIRKTAEEIVLDEIVYQPR